MKSFARSTWGLACGIVTLVAIGCGGGSGTKPDGGAGSSGNSGSAGTGGSAGAGGSAGTGGDVATAGTGGAGGGGGSAAGGSTGGQLMQDASVDSAPVGDASPDGLEPYPRPTYQKLSETGLYANIATMTIAGDALPFQPAHQLWSDAADKRRWVRFPPGSRIDTTDMDRWQFPIGTKVWKEFSRGGTLLETRLIERYGPGAEDYFMMAFVWAADRSDATAAPDGAANVNGTTHDVPLTDQCGSCHRGERGRILGLSAIQMSHTGPGLNLAELVASNRLSAPPPAGTSYPVPGDPTTAAALGYLHANCGHCHVANTSAYQDTKMIMRLSVTERVASETALYRALVGKELDFWDKAPYTHRVVPGNPGQSAIIARMMARGSKDQMPPLASEVADATAITAISAWITALPP